MPNKLHKNAKLTPKVREEISKSNKSARIHAEKYNVTQGTIYKWKHRCNFQDNPSIRKRLCFTLNELEEQLICEVKRFTLFSIEDMLQVLNPLIPQLNRSNLHRCLCRNKLNRNDLIIEKTEKKKDKHKKFKDYDTGFLHIDIKYLPKIEGVRQYLFVAIDRKTRICFVKIYDNQDKESAVDFLDKCSKFYDFKIIKLLTDNGKCFTDRFRKGKKEPSGNHLFDLKCNLLNIEHRLTLPYTPKTNGMVERMNRRFTENVLDKYQFSSLKDMANKINEYIYLYNSKIQQKALGYLSPLEYYKILTEKENKQINDENNSIMENNESFYKNKFGNHEKNVNFANENLIEMKNSIKYNNPKLYS